MPEMGDEGVRLEDAIGGGTDVFSSFAESAESADHLIVMIHGILGSTADWQYGASQFVKSLSDKVIVHCSERNMNMLSLDGVDVMGERVAEEVVEVINRRPGFRKISFVAHSVGGLVARYAIGKLYRPPKRECSEDQSFGACDENPRGTICGLEAINFITVATPHLGSRGNKQVPFLFGVTAIEKLASCIIHLILRRTGRHLFLTDIDEGELPLLQRMVDDHGDLYFLSALRAFKRRVAYANADCDRIVGWRTSSIRRNTELPKWEDSINEKYPHIVYEEHSKGIDAEKCAEASVLNEDNGGSDILEEGLVTGLSQVSWERVDVSFNSCRQKYAAHSKIIQVKHSLMDTEGTDVIQHMIDHFLT